MFNSKQKTLINNKVKATSANSFIKEATKETSKRLTGNGAIQYSKTDDDFVTEFGSLGSYKEPREINEIFKTMSILWSVNPRLSVYMIFFIRLITRTVKLFNGKSTNTVQRGQGLKHEAIVRMMWLGIYHPEVFIKNLPLFICVGSWKDVFVMLSYDLQYNNWKNKVLPWDYIGKTILAGLENPETSNLVKKYLPQIKSNNQCTTLKAQSNNIIAKWICSLLFGGKQDDYSKYKQYRNLKVSGTAHQWQQLISQKKHDLVNFNTIAGRALSQLVSSKYLDNQNQTERYEKWLESKPVAKFTGYPHELFKKLPNRKYQIDTLNKQFLGLIETASKDINRNTGLIVVRDTSGSMMSPANGETMTCFNIAKSLALYFSYLLPNGHFSGNWIEFNKAAVMHEWKGNTPYEKYTNDKANCIGNTNFQSVIDLFIRIKESGVPEEEFPTGILCISDGEFDPASLSKTNVEVIRKKMAEYFSQEFCKNFKIVLWDLRNYHYGNRSRGFETHNSLAENTFYFSGYDGSTISFLTGKENKEESTPKNAKELFDAAMNQEIMSMIEM